MSDRYRYRAWNGRAMEHGGFAIHATGKTIIDTPALTDVTEDSPIMQCTGLKDRNGKLIYEGDLISAFNDVEICFVIFKDGGFLVSNNKYINVHISQDYLDKCSYKIIGNVHEHPELVDGL
jgi:uncharacterized phage protein (TIGR01671 family)